MDSIVEKLEALGLDKFIRQYQHELCKTTLNQNKVAAFLQFDFDQSSIINHSPDNFSKCQKLYEFIEKKCKVKDFLEALEATGNEHIIEFIEAVHLSVQGESSSWSTNPKTGIWFDIPEPTANSSSAPTSSAQAHFDNKGPSQNSQGNVNCHFTQIVNLQNHPESTKTRSADQVKGHDEAGNSNLKPGIWFDIPLPISSFCGRENFLSELHEKLQSQDSVNSQSTAAVAGPSGHRFKAEPTTSVIVLSQVNVVSGLGGIGKTETATQYINTHRQLYNNFIWIHGESESSMSNSFTQLARQLQIPVKNSEGNPREIKEIVKEIYNKICEGGKTNFMVFDNAEDYQSCKDFFPLKLHPDLRRLIVILATSRNQQWTSSTEKIQVLSLGVLTDDESLEFILKQLEIEDSPEFREESKEFIQLIGGLPLALQQAVAYIKNEKELQKFLGKSYSIKDYVQEFKKSMKKFQKFPPNPESSVTVYVTWNVTLLKFFTLEHGENAILLLSNLSFLYADKIPLPFLHDLVPAIEDRRFSEALKLIEKYSLIKMNFKELCLGIHRQLQFVILQYLHESDDIFKLMTNLFEKFGVVLERVKISNESETNDIFINIHQIYKNPFKYSETEQVRNFTFKFASILSKAGRYSESLQMHKTVHQMFEKAYGDDHQQTLVSLIMVANQLFKVGRYDECLALCDPLLNKISDHPNYGKDHPLAISTKGIIATVLPKQSNFKASMEHAQEMLSQSIRIYGKSHPEVVEMTRVVAYLCSRLGDSSTSTDLWQEFEKKMTITPHSKDADVFQMTKAIRFSEKGEFGEAARIYKEIYEESKATLGESHAETLDALVSLTTASKQLTNDFSEALNQYRKVQEIRKKSLGVDHPDSIDVKLKIAITLFEMKDYDESLKMLQEIYNQLPKVSGTLQKQALSFQYAIALLYFNQGERQKGLELLRDVEQKQTKVLGSDHADTRKTRNTMLDFLKIQALTSN